MCLMMLGALNLHPQSLRTRGGSAGAMSMDNILKNPTMINALNTEASLRDPITLHTHHQLI